LTTAKTDSDPDEDDISENDEDDRYESGNMTGKATRTTDMEAETMTGKATRELRL
jgi:hypothetical protein